MDKVVTQMLEAVNLKLKDRPLIYFSREAERSIGLENLLENYHIACIEDHYIVDQLLEKNKDVFCLERFDSDINSKSSLSLISSQKTQDWVRGRAHNLNFYGWFFQINEPLIRKVKMMHGEVVNNQESIARRFEMKLSAFEFFTKHGIPIPKSRLTILDDGIYTSLVQELGPVFVIQLDRSHTGGGTFVIRDEEAWLACLKVAKGNTAKASEFIKGDAYTINACITKKGVFVNGLQYQITGIPELTSGEGSTVGNDWSYANALNEELKTDVVNLISKIGMEMGKSGYRGLFGVDLILRDGKWYVVEINARQTANLAMQTKLELAYGVTPLLLLHLSEFLGVDIPISPWAKVSALEGSQIFLRAKNEEAIIRNEMRSGIYRLQSDSAARDLDGGLETQTDIIFIDENDQDKPLIWQNEGYSVEDIKNGGFVLLCQKNNTVRKRHEELLRFQFKNQIVYSGLVAPWIIEAMREIERNISR